jgi:HTH-type transcriptional regulator/antitoxin HipB
MIMDNIARTLKQLGAVIRRNRKQHGLTQAALGSLISKRQATISNLESAESGTTLETLFSVLAALDLELVVRARTKGDATPLGDLF